MKLTVDISDARVSSDSCDELITYSLGSCIGVSLHDPTAQIGGMLHFQLPSGKKDPEKGRTHPLMFADTGMEWLLRKMKASGANQRRITVKLAGGAQMMNDSKMFQIGKRNYAAIRQILWKKGMFIDAEDVGGKFARSFSLNINDGQAKIRSQGVTKKL